MTDDTEQPLVERLRWSDGWFFENPWDHVTYASDDPFEAADEIERLREALRSAIRNIENLTYDIKCHTECAECQSNVAMYEHAVEEYRAALGETK